MSHASGEVFSQTGEHLGWFDYSGTSDFACPTIFKTYQELSDNFGKEIPHPYCHCQQGKPKDPNVVLYSHYGYGFHWDAMACLKCMIITHRLEPRHYEQSVGLGWCNEDAENWNSYDGHPFSNTKKSGA